MECVKYGKDMGALPLSRFDNSALLPNIGNDWLKDWWWSPRWNMIKNMTSKHHHSLSDSTHDPYLHVKYIKCKHLEQNQWLMYLMFIKAPSSIKWVRWAWCKRHLCAKIYGECWKPSLGPLFANVDHWSKFCSS